MKSFLLFLFVAACLESASAQTSLPGTWRGSSICQVKNSPCHDEVVVGYITPRAGKDSFDVTLNKIVEGKEVNMGVLIFFLDASGNFISVDEARGVRWELRREAQRLFGRLVYKGQLYRLIDLKKDG